MKTTHKQYSKMKVLLILLTFSLIFPTVASTDLSDTKRDTVILALNNSKILIITQDKADLDSLENYDINQMIRDLNDQLSDSVKYMEIENGKSYVNEDVDIKITRSGIHDDDLKVKIGSIELEVSPISAEDIYQDDWGKIKKEVYEEERVDKTTYSIKTDIGLNNWLDDGSFPTGNTPYTVKSFGSWYVAINSINSTKIKGPLFLEWGGGISWYNWKLENPDYKVQKGMDEVEFKISPTTQKGKRSKLTASYINVLLVPMLDFSKGRKKIASFQSGEVKINRYARTGLRFGVGVYAGYRLGSHIKFIYREDGARDKEKKRDNFFLENFRYGLRGQVGWNDVSFFANYDLNNVFSENRGPINADGQNAKLRAISFGLSFGFCHP